MYSSYWFAYFLARNKFASVVMEFFFSIGSKACIHN